MTLFKRIINTKTTKFLFIVGVIFNWSCNSYRNIPYFEDLKNNISKEPMFKDTPYLISKGDILTIHLSSLNPRADIVFNSNNDFKLDKVSNGLNDEILSQNTSNGYLVDNDGNIELPYAGRMKVAGQTTKDLTLEIESKLKDYFTSPIITIRIQNFRVTVFGDVKNPGVFRVENEKINVTEALSLAGDLNITGMRTNLLLIREDNGTRQYVHLDLTSKEIFNSPYYYLKNNDQIYVQPDRKKASSADNTTFQKASLAVAVLSLIAYLIRFH